jgi:hypothetical protein
LGINNRQPASHIVGLIISLGIGKISTALIESIIEDKIQLFGGEGKSCSGIEKEGAEQEWNG